MLPPDWNSAAAALPPELTYTMPLSLTVIPDAVPPVKETTPPELTVVTVAVPPELTFTLPLVLSVVLFALPPELTYILPPSLTVVLTASPPFSTYSFSPVRTIPSLETPLEMNVSAILPPRLLNCFVLKGTHPKYITGFAFFQVCFRIRSRRVSRLLRRR